MNLEYSMNDEAVRNLLRQLHSVLGGEISITEKDRELLERLVVDIQALLARPGAATRATQQSIIARLQEAVSRFEVSHPDFTATMAQVSKTLADMGI
jgi:hypothetical protein